MNAQKSDRRTSALVDYLRVLISYTGRTKYFPSLDEVDYRWSVVILSSHEIVINDEDVLSVFQFSEERAQPFKWCSQCNDVISTSVIPFYRTNPGWQG